MPASNTGRNERMSSLVGWTVLSLAASTAPAQKKHRVVAGAQVLVQARGGEARREGEAGAGNIGQLTFRGIAVARTNQTDHRRRREKLGGQGQWGGGKRAGGTRKERGTEYLTLVCGCAKGLDKRT